MTGFSTLVAIAIFCWGFGPGRLELNKRNYLSTRENGRGSCNIADSHQWSSDIRSMTLRRPFLSDKFCTVHVFSLATNILERHFLSNRVSMGARLFFVINVEEVPDLVSAPSNNGVNGSLCSELLRPEERF